MSSNLRTSFFFQQVDPNSEWIQGWNHRMGNAVVQFSCKSKLFYYPEEDAYYNWKGEKVDSPYNNNNSSKSNGKHVQFADSRKRNSDMICVATNGISKKNKDVSIDRIRADIGVYDKEATKRLSAERLNNKGSLSFYSIVTSNMVSTFLKSIETCNEFGVLYCLDGNENCRRCKDVSTGEVIYIHQIPNGTFSEGANKGFMDILYYVGPIVNPVEGESSAKDRYEKLGLVLYPNATDALVEYRSRIGTLPHMDVEKMKEYRIKLRANEIIHVLIAGGSTAKSISVIPWAFKRASMVRKSAKAKEPDARSEWEDEEEVRPKTSRKIINKNPIRIEQEETESDSDSEEETRVKARSVVDDEETEELADQFRRLHDGNGYLDDENMCDLTQDRDDGEFAGVIPDDN